MKLWISVLFFWLTMGNMNAQSNLAPPIQWQKSYAGTEWEFADFIQQTFDGGYILGGISSSDISEDKTENTQGTYDYWIIKLNNIGEIEWQNDIGTYDWDEFKAIHQTTDSGYIIGGSSAANISGDKTNNSKGLNDYWVLKLNKLGEIQWQKTIGGKKNDQLFDLQQTKDGGYILGGRSESNISGDKTENSKGLLDYWIVKISGIGNIQWQNTIGGNNNDYFESIQQTSDSGYIIGGYSYSDIGGDKSEHSMGINDYWIVKTDKRGHIEWENTIGANLNDELKSIIQTKDAGYFVGGYSQSDISGDKTEACQVQHYYDYWVLKLNTSGEIVWQNTIGGYSDDFLFSVLETDDCISSSDKQNSIMETYECGYILGGYSGSGISGDKTDTLQNSHGGDYWIVKLNADGEIIWQKSIGESGVLTCNFKSIQKTEDGGYIICGDHFPNFYTDWDYWVVKLGPEIVSGIHNNLQDNGSISILPNPNAGHFNLQLKDVEPGEYTLNIHDLKGSLIHSQLLDITSLNYNTIIELPDDLKGLLILNISNEKDELYEKFMVK